MIQSKRKINKKRLTRKLKKYKKGNKISTQTNRNKRNKISTQTKRNKRNEISTQTKRNKRNKISTQTKRNKRIYNVGGGLIKKLFRKKKSASTGATTAATTGATTAAPPSRSDDDNSEGYVVVDNKTSNDVDFKRKFILIRHGFSKANYANYNTSQNPRFIDPGSEIAKNQLDENPRNNYNNDTLFADIINKGGGKLGKKIKKVGKKIKKIKHVTMLDPPLDEQGVIESHIANTELKNNLGNDIYDSIKYVICSAMKRAIETALFMFPDKDIIVCPYLIENVGKGGGVARDNQVSNPLTQLTHHSARIKFLYPSNNNKQKKTGAQLLTANIQNYNTLITMNHVDNQNRIYYAPDTLKSENTYSSKAKQGNINDFMIWYKQDEIQDYFKNWRNGDKLTKGFVNNFSNSIGVAEYIPIVSHSHTIAHYLKNLPECTNDLHPQNIALANNQAILVEYNDKYGWCYDTLFKGYVHKKSLYDKRKKQEDDKRKKQEEDKRAAAAIVIQRNSRRHSISKENPRFSREKSERIKSRSSQRRKNRTHSELHSKLFAPLPGDEGSMETLQQINDKKRSQTRGSSVLPPLIQVTNGCSEHRLNEIERIPKNELNAIFQTKIIDQKNTPEIRDIERAAAEAFVKDTKKDGKYLVDLWRSHKNHVNKTKRSGPVPMNEKLFKSTSMTRGLLNIMGICLKCRKYDRYMKDAYTQK